MTASNSAESIDPILRWSEVSKIVPICRSHAHAMAAKGEFPKPIKIGPRASGWLQSEILQWLEDRKAERDGGAGAHVQAEAAA